MIRSTRIAAVAIALLVASCSDGPTPPVTTDLRPQLSSNQGGDLEHIARYKSGSMPRFAFALRLIGPAGGTVKVAGFEVNVPKGAVSRLTLFTILLPHDPLRDDYVWAEFGPHGQRFARPVTIKLPYQGTTSEGTAPRVLWNNAGTWVAMPTNVTGDGRIETKTNHFSEYGTEETAFSKGIIVSQKRGW
jgi:hypothetical protein